LLKTASVVWEEMCVLRNVIDDIFELYGKAILEKGLDHMDVIIIWSHTRD